jgi:DNA gyrase subunit A
MICIDDMQANVLVVSEKGYGKRSDIEEYRITNRGGKGVKTINITDKTGNLVGIKSVTDANDLMIITKNGITIRMNVSDLRVMGRATQGVRLINIQDSDSIAAVTKVDHEEEIQEDAVNTMPENPVDGTEAPENGTENTSTDNIG